MAKKDTDMYHSRLTQVDLDELIIKYNIPCDLHPRLSSKGFVISELLDDAIGVYHRVFNFSGVRIPFSSILFYSAILVFRCLLEWAVQRLRWHHHDSSHSPRLKLPHEAKWASLSLALLRAMLPTFPGLPWPSQLGGTRAGVLSLLLLKVLASEAIMTDVAGASSGGAGRPWPSSAPTSFVRDLSGDAIHRDLFPFSPGPYYTLYLEGEVPGSCKFIHEEWDTSYQPTLSVLTKEVFKDLAVCKTVVDQFPTLGEMVWIEALSNDQLTAKISVLYFLMLSYGGELLARWAAFQGLDSEVSGIKKQVTNLNDKLSSSDAVFVKAKAKGKDQKKMIKSLSKNLDQLTAKLARLSAALNQATVLEAERDAEILRLKAYPYELTSFFQGGSQSLVRKFFLLVTTLAEFKVNSFLWLPVLVLSVV
ncbi:hypothetical protein Tco_0309333 [Tanacetum coccineum]